MFTVSNLQFPLRGAGELAPEDRLVLISRQETLVRPRGGMPELPTFREAGSLVGGPLVEIGCFPDGRCFAGYLDAVPERIPEGMELWAGRAILASGAETTRTALCRGREMLLWRETHRFCGKCRAQMRPSAKDLAMICPECGSMYFPQIAPAVIVAITRDRGREILLAHNRRFADGIYSLIAGFVEAGESVEQAVHREIREETHIEVDHLRYLTSQSWPFPNSLMLAFSAEYAGGEAFPDGEELADCRWFRREALPPIPPPGSVARQVLDSFASGSL